MYGATFYDRHTYYQMSTGAPPHTTKIYARNCILSDIIAGSPALVLVCYSGDIMQLLLFFQSEYSIKHIKMAKKVPSRSEAEEMFNQLGKFSSFKYTDAI